MTPADYTNIAGMPCETSQALLAALQQNPALLTFLNTYRTKGLQRLKTTDIDPQVKLLMLNLRLEDTMHEVATCMDHFLGVFDVLKSWGHPDDVASIGLIHAIYGTKFNQVRLVDCQSPAARQAVAGVIGSGVESWAYMFGTLCTEDYLWQVYTTGRPAETRYDLALNANVALPEADFVVMAEALVANSYEPALTDKPLLGRLKQFELLSGYLSPGALAAIEQYKIFSGDQTSYVPTQPTGCQYIVPSVGAGVDVSMCRRFP